MFKKFFYLSFLLLISSCNLAPENELKNIARYGESYLSVNDLESMFGDVDKADSISKVNNLINNWAIEKILIERAELNLNEIKLNKIESLVSEFRSTLLSEVYLEALVNSSIDLEIDSVEIQNFYNKNKSLFNLNEDIFKIVYVELPIGFSDTYEVRSKIKRYKTNDKFFLDSISYRFNDFSLSGDKWISKKEMFKKFPFLSNYSYKSLKNYNFFQFKDSLSLYLIKIIESVNNGDVSPIDYVLPTLEYMSLNNRKKELMLNIKTDILKDALKENKLEIY